MKITLSKLIREAAVIDLTNSQTHTFIRPGPRLVGAKRIYIEEQDFDDVASQLVGQGFKHASSEDIDG